ncbi:type IX secretion system sortase PorU [Lutibacter agarilyticus]|uniref:type IX secretion system sortase PorU n=1 Tax=Lutibacter agarilyticus TaxID=1109740 RepID=UPI001FEA09F5|nr:type IX secretion system sortase PorU [Lutibacter agarilyticus]
MSKIFFFVLFIALNALYSQEKEFKNIQLNWLKSVDFEVSTSSVFKVDLVEGNTLDAHLNPTFSEAWKISNTATLVNFSYKNVVYETVSANEISKFNAEKIPTELQISFNFSKLRADKWAILEFSPLIKEGNSIKRITSLDLEYEIIQTQSKQTTKTTIKNSVLASGEWYKFSIDTTGVFKLDRGFIESLGLDLNGVNPKNIQIYGNGGAMLPFNNSDFRQDGLQQNAILISGEDDGSFNKDDYILFYGQGPHQWENSSNNLASLEHQFNIFSEEAFYFITVGNSEGLRVRTSDEILETAASQITDFEDYIFYEKDEVNLFAVGQQWFGDSFSIENTRKYSIPFNDLENSKDLIVRVRGVVESSISSTMDVKVNNQNLFSINYGASSGLTHAYANRGSGITQLSGNSVNVEVTFNNNGNPSANAYLDYIEVLGTKKLIASGNQFSFRNFEVMNTNEVFEFSIENASNIASVWNVSNSLNPTIIENESDNSNFNFKVKGGGTHEFLVLNEGDYYKPSRLTNSRVENQNLHSLSNLDYIIITQDYLINSAQKLANYHNENSNLKVQVIPLNQIYNEFSSGSPDLTAIRDFAKHLYDNASTNKLKYMCLFGDASYDYKDRIGGNNNIVPVFEAYKSFNLASSYVTDDYYGMMDDNEGDLGSFDRQDIVTGRIPVTSALEADQVVDKILNYYSEDSFGNWRSKITLVADDIDERGEETIQVNMEKLADTILANKPLFNLKKIYADAYVQETSSGGQRYPAVNIDIVNQVEKGTLLVDYFGHGGEDGWAKERIFEVPEIQSFKNKIKLPLFVTVTCEFTRFDNPLRKTAGEYLLWNPNGGSGALISTTRAIFISVGQAFNERLIKPLLNFNNENYTIAETLMNVKNQFSTSQRFFIFLFGDPAMVLHVPKPAVKITKMNGIDVNQSLDTIKALSYVEFEGEVTNEAGNLLSDFNGEFEVTVFDKPIQKKTLDNDNFNFIMEFDVLESKIFTGRSTVENGKFTFDFIAPKDIKIAYGKGKLSFYASNKIEDKAGYSFDVEVGGINTNAPEDVIGPTVQLYMNDLNFVDGANTNESPVFIAVLEDESGINTSITAVDHDIIAILDNDQSNPIILNDYYETDLNDFKKGQVSYPFRNLSPGLHTITLKVWDTYNNMSESTFSFFVVDDSDLVLTNVLNYPNPFISHTEFWFNHNKPNQLLNVQVQIFTISGKLVKTINQTVQSEGNLSRSITWNGLDDFGSRIGKGVYVYKLNVTAVNTNIKAEKIEKLVILQ